MPDLARARFPTPIALLALAALACGLAASTWHVFGHTWDEPEHIAAGMSLVDGGHYVYDIQHPPIARAMLAVGPYLAGARSQGKPGPDGRPEGDAILYSDGHYERYLTLARAGALPFLALLVVMGYLWARQVVAPASALVAAAFVATTPAVLGHGALASLDVPAAATGLLALYAVALWLESGRLRDALWVGLTLGLALGTKLSALPFCGLGVLLLWGLRRWERAGRADARPPIHPWRWTTGILLGVLVIGLVLTLAYGGRFVYLTDKTQPFGHALWYLFGKTGTLRVWGESLFALFPVPEAFPMMLGGIEALTVHNRSGHLSYLLGEVRTTGWWYFYPVALAVKTPLPFLALGLSGLGFLARDGWVGRDARALAVPLLFAAILGFSMAISHINIGVRHLLILYPLLAVGAAYLLAKAYGRARLLGGVSRVVTLSAVLALPLLELAIVARTGPDYLAYFNALAPDPEAVLVDSDLDWGQDLRPLAVRLRALEVRSISLAYLGTADLDHEGLPPWVLLKPDERATGWVAVSALARVHAPHRYGWLDRYPRRERIGASIDLYYVPPGGV